MRVHEKKCKGLIDPRQCQTCLKVFTSAWGRLKHNKNVKCAAPTSAPPSSSEPQTININNNINNNCNTTIHNTNCNNTTIHNNNVMNFYSITEKDIDQIVERLSEKEYFKIVMDNINKGKYAIPSTVERIYFNKEFPNMQTLKKERRNDKMVDVHVGEGKWEKRMLEDVFKMVVRKVEEYHAKYFYHMHEKYQSVDKTSSRWKHLIRPIKSFGNQMLWYEGFQGDAIEGVGIDLNYPDEDEEMEKERERRNKEMEQLVGEKLYNETLEVIKRAELTTKNNGRRP